MCASKHGKRYILEVDIRQFFDTINQQWLLDNIPMETRILRKLLRAGILDLNHFTPGEMGVPQGGVLSPCLANTCLDGLEKTLCDKLNVYLVRYADDFVIAGKSQNQLEEAKEIVEKFLAIRGLSVNEDKTSITTIERGFNFLGFHFREYPDKGRIAGGKKRIFLVKPSKEKITNILRKISVIIKRYPNAESGTLIKELNPILRG